MLVVIVTETTASAEVDKNYVDAFLSYFYGSSGIRFVKKHVFAKSKSNYDKVEKRINEIIRQYNQNHDDGDIHVVFCFDTDYGRPHASCNGEIESYCRQNHYDLVWFHTDVEEVFLGHRVEDRDKKKKAEEFRRKQDKSMQSIPVEIFRGCNRTSSKVRASNIKVVFDQIFIGK